MHNFLRTATVLITCTVLMAAHSCDRGVKNPISENAKVGEAIATCAIDADCTVVKEDCCGCTAGGKQRAIAVSGAEAWLNKLAGECGDTICAQMMSRHPSCSQKPTCLQGRCELK